MFLKDGDGSISWEELGFVMKTLGHKVSEKQLKAIMKLIDENGKLFIYQEISLSISHVFKFFEKGDGVIVFEGE